MKYDKSKYVGKQVRLYPGDTYYKFATIIDLDELGWMFKITKSHPSNGSNWKVGQTYFINHSNNVIFEFI